MGSCGALDRITRDDLAPLWNRREVPLDRIAAALGVSRQGLSWKAKALGLAPRGQNQEPNKRGSDDLFRRMWMAGVNVREMAEHFGYARKECISVRRRMMGLPARSRGGKVGSRSGWAETVPLSAFLKDELIRRMHEHAASRSAAPHPIVSAGRKAAAAPADPCRRGSDGPETRNGGSEIAFGVRGCV